MTARLRPPNRPEPQGRRFFAEDGNYRRPLLEEPRLLNERKPRHSGLPSRLRLRVEPDVESAACVVLDGDFFVVEPDKLGFVAGTDCEGWIVTRCAI